MTKEQVEQEVEKHDTILLGRNRDGTDGVCATVKEIGQTLYGTKSDPGGLVSNVRQIKWLMWVMVVVIALDNSSHIWKFAGTLFAKVN